MINYKFMLILYPSCRNRGPGNDTVDYFSSKKEKVDQLKTIALDLQIQYNKLYSNILQARR